MYLMWGCGSPFFLSCLNLFVFISRNSQFDNTVVKNFYIYVYLTGYEEIILLCNKYQLSVSVYASPTSDHSNENKSFEI